ncbi:MAG: hypothetical protein QM820_57180 [Minicystis sp.]
MMLEQNLTREERRTILISVLTTAATTAATGLVSWAIDVLRRKTEPKPDKNEPR